MRVVELLDILRSEAGNNPDAEVRVIFYTQDGLPLDSRHNVQGIKYHVRVNGGGVHSLNIIAEPEPEEGVQAREKVKTWRDVCTCRCIGYVGVPAAFSHDEDCPVFEPDDRLSNHIEGGRRDVEAGP